MPPIAAKAPEPSPDRPLELTIVRPTLGSGGADRVTLTLLRHLDRRRFDISLVLMRREGELLGEVPDDVRLHELGAGSLWSAWLPLSARLRSNPPDILFSTSSGMNLPAVLAHRVSGSASRLVLSERNMLRTRLGVRRRLLALAKRFLYGSADRVTAVSTEVARELRERVGVEAGRITVTHNPVVDDELRRMAEAPLDHAWFRDATPTILSAGRMVPEKDFATLLEAFARVRSRRDVRLVLLGEGPLRSELESQAARAGVEADVDFPGFDPNPFRYMSRCAVFVLSSTYEGLPGVLIQAMACGAPAISTDYEGGAEEIVTSGETGILVPVADPEALAAAIERVLDDPEERARLRRRGAQAVERFGVEEVLARYQEALLGASVGHET